MEIVRDVGKKVSVIQNGVPHRCDVQTASRRLPPPPAIAHGPSTHPLRGRGIARAPSAEGLAEHKIRDLNDQINKLLREKYHWEKRIKELGGPDYAVRRVAMQGRACRAPPRSYRSPHAQPTATAPPSF